MRQPFYQVKGALPANAPSYIKRDADDILYNALIAHQYCYVLNYRQIGKSSLKNSCAKRLEEIGHHCIHIDLTQIGSKDIAVEQWYFSFMHIIVRSLELSEQTFIKYWLNENLTVVSRVALIIENMILTEIENNITIFVDEIDFILSINKFNTDNFFAMIRRFYNLRGEDKRYNRLTFVLLGVASARDLMQDSSRTPFNIAENIKISQLQLEQSYPLTKGLNDQILDKREILKKVFEYTSGTSFLTQKILDHIAKHPIKSLEEVENIVDILFIQEGFNEINLSNIQERIIKNKTHNVKMLYIIEKILNGEKIETNGRRQTYIYLKLSGLIKKESNYLVYNNLIYKKIFNEEWLDAIINKLNRPIVRYLQKWNQHGMSKKYLLKKESLQEIEKWANKRDDLLAEEQKYLSLSHQEESKKEREKLEEERKNLSKKILEEKKKFNEKILKQRNIVIKMTQLFVLTLLLAVGGGIYYNYSIKEALKLKYENKKIELENEKIKLKIQAKEKDDYYRNLLKAKLKGGTKEYYLWEIDTYEHLDDNQTQYKIAEASIHLGRLYKDRKKSEKYYKKAIKIYKKGGEKYKIDLAETYTKFAYKYQSIEYYNKALEIYKKNPYTFQVQIANIYYKMIDPIINQGDYAKANEYYKNGFIIYRNLIRKDPSKYINKLAESFEKKAKIVETEQGWDRKKSKNLYKKAINIYKEIGKNLYLSEIKKIESKLKEYQINKIYKGEGWIYIGKFEKNIWINQNFWLPKPNISKGDRVIAIDNLNFRDKPLAKAKKLKKHIDIGDIITILKVDKKIQDDGVYIWAKVKY